MCPLLWLWIKENKQECLPSHLTVLTAPYFSDTVYGLFLFWYTMCFLLNLINFFSYVLCFETTGRPKGVKEQDVYICDYRLDKSAHLFYKIHRNRYPVCTKPYAFDHFPKKLTPKRDFSVSVSSLSFLTFLLKDWTYFLNASGSLFMNEAW